MQSTERIKSLDIKSLATVSERDAKSTDFVAWCEGQTYSVLVYDRSGVVISELLFNSATSCYGANTVEIASLPGGAGADATGDPTFARLAGIPLAASYAPPADAAVQPAEDANPCLGEDKGWTTGLVASFFAGPFGGSAKGAFSLTFSGNATLQRCDCPNHKAVDAPWPGTPALPAGAFSSDYGVRMKGQFLVARPADGVVGETPAIFPNASDYHLLCLQHDDSAEMLVDGVSLYRQEASTWSAAGFKQFCTPVALAPGWHDLTLTYGSGPAGAASVLRFFVIDAAEVAAVQAGGQTTYEISWKGKCCTGGANTVPSCMQPLDCCRFRNAGGCSPAVQASLPQSAPKPAPMQAPMCQLFAVDMAYCGGEGLITDKASALVVMACSPGVSVCGDCFNVSGPANATVDFFSYAAQANSTYQLSASWEPSYRGPVTIGIEAQRQSGACSIQSADGAAVAPVDSLAFNVRDNVQVKAVAYKLYHGCEGPQCSFTL
ncbi:hypothetical protein WJX81_004558 [Elliptochloris bilobata]|uniref:PA14 domain-containing protein n=1 Tax=Elliptochloris bilobata TaxID=381761 RepID=A0AAW1RH58_9CHLO